MATTGHWYVDNAGAKVNFGTAITANVANIPIWKVTSVAGDRPNRVLWKGVGAAVTAGEITDATADQDSAAVPANLAPAGDVARPGAASTETPGSNVRLVSPNGHTFQASIANNGTVTWTDLG